MESEKSDEDKTLTNLFDIIKAEDDTRALNVIRRDNRIALESDAEGRTALHYAAKVGREAVVKALLNHGADPNAQHVEFKHTPLHLSAKRGHALSSKFLLECGADPNAQNKFQRTPLHYAAEDGHESVVQMLLDAGADRTIVDKYGHTPSSLAVQNKRHAVIQLFNKPQVFRRSSESSVEGIPDRKEVAEPRKPLLRDKEKERLCRFFQGAVWEMKGKTLTTSPASVFDIVYGNILNTADGISWIHLPANNRDWVMDLVDCICTSKPYAEAKSIKAFVNSTFRRTGRDTAHRRPHFAKGSNRGMWAIVVPVLDVDLDEETKTKMVSAQRNANATSDETATLLERQVNALLSLDAKYTDSLHMPRSLDRAYYEFLDAEVLIKRDREQVMLRYLTTALKNTAPNNASCSSKFNDGNDCELDDLSKLASNTARISKSEPAKATMSNRVLKESSFPQIIMVRQLWLWKLDDNTIITTFPDRWDTDNSATFYNRLESTMKANATCTANEICKSIIDRCVDFIEVEYSLHKGGEFKAYNCSSVFASSIARLSENIHRRYGQFQERLRKGKANQTILADLDHEMSYLAEIDDILDELTMIKRALNNQAYVTNKVLEELAEPNMQKASSISSYYSHPHLEVFERLSDDARRVRKCITTLLDLRQKEATIDEARSSAQQSTVLFIFTAATVIFAPLSFATSLLALQINGFKEPFHPGWVAKVLGLSVAITAAILIFIYAIAWLAKYIQFQLSRERSGGGDGGSGGGRDRRSIESEGSKVGSTRDGGGSGGIANVSWAPNRSLRDSVLGSQFRERKIKTIITDVERGRHSM